jgi:Xaa-Pro dipeptidase
MSDSPKDLAARYGAHVGTLAERFEEALEAAGFERVAIFAGDPLVRHRDDHPYPFRCDPYFAQWLPLHDAPGSVLLFEPGRKPRLVFRQEDDFWHVPPEAPGGHWTAHFEIDIARSANAVAEALVPWHAHCAAIGTGALTSGAFEACDDPALLSRLDFERACKTAYEVECMARANRIAAAGHAIAGTAFGDGISEFDLDVVYTAETSQREIDLPYGNIVAVNEHAAVLHYQHLDHEAPATARSFLIDAGAAYGGYAADVTRTWQHREPRFAELIASMEMLQQTLCTEVAPGVEYVDLNERAHVLLADVLTEHGIVKCSSEEAYASGLTRAFLPHGLGHLLGLQVHDVGGWQRSPDGELRRPPETHPFLRLTRRLEPGFAFTVEPGLYFIDSLLGKLDRSVAKHIDRATVDALRPCGGVRIEDDLVVESTASRNLTREAFASLDVA